MFCNLQVLSPNDVNDAKEVKDAKDGPGSDGKVSQVANDESEAASRGESDDGDEASEQEVSLFMAKFLSHMSALSLAPHQVATAAAAGIDANDTDHHDDALVSLRILENQIALLMQVVSPVTVDDSSSCCSTIESYSDFDSSGVPDFDRDFDRDFADSLEDSLSDNEGVVAYHLRANRCQRRESSKSNRSVI